MPQRVIASSENGDYVKSFPRKDIATFSTDSCSSVSTGGFSTLSTLPQIRAGGAFGRLFHNGYAPMQGLSMVRFSSTSTGQRLEDELGNTAGVGNNAEVFNVGNADVATTLATSKAEAISEVSAVIGDCSYPTAFLQLFLENVHVYTGLPWWASIVVTTVGIRLLCAPVILYQLRSAAKLSLMRPEMERINAEIKNSGHDPMVAAAGRERIMALFAKYNTSPFSPFIGVLLQAPIFMSFFFGIQNMAGRVESFKDGGALWFTDLSAVDSTYILPILLSGSMLLTIELNAAEGMEGNPFADKMKNFMRLFSVILFPVSLNFPSALFCYWITSTYFSLLQSAIFKDPRVKEYLNIPSTTHLAAQPQPNLATTPTPSQPAPSHTRAKTIGRKKSRGFRRR